MSKKNKPQVAFGIYTGRYVSGTAPMNMLTMAFELAKADMWGGMEHVSSCRVDSNRNYLIHDFLHETTNDYLFIVDEDMQHPGPMPVVLAERELPVVSGLYFRRNEGREFYPQFYKYEGQSEETRRGHGKAVNDYYRAMLPEVVQFFGSLDNVPNVDTPLILTHADGTVIDNGLMRIDGGGFGCLMIRRDVLEKLDEPYLICEPGLNGDLVFYKQLREKGIEVWGDCSVIATHNYDDHVGVGSFCDFANRYVASGNTLEVNKSDA